MPLNLDFSDVDNSFEKPTEDDHVFLIEDAVVQPTKKGDSNNLVITASVVGGESDGRSLKQFFNLQPQSLWKVKLFLEAVVGEELESITVHESELVGQTFIGTVRYSEDGKYANLEAFEHNS